MKEHGRRRYLQTVGGAATGLATATAGCSSLGGLLGSGSEDVRSLIAHPGWFDPAESDVVDEDPEVVVASYEDSAALKEHSETLADWLTESETLFGLDAAIERYMLTILSKEVNLVEYVDAEALSSAARENDAYRSIADVDGYHGQVGDGYLSVTGDGWAMGVGFPDGEVPDRPADELLTGYARLLENRPSEFTAGTERLDRLNRLYDAVGPATMGTFNVGFEDNERVDATARVFEVESDRTTVRAAGVGSSLDPQEFKEYELGWPNRDYSDYDDLEVSESDGVIVLTGTTSTETFDKLSPD